MNHELTLNDFEMDESFKRKFKCKINNLLNVSPSDAGASSKITKTEVGYSGVLQLFSSQGKFIAEASERNLNDLTKSLVQTMYRQIETWRSHRFTLGR